MPTGAHISDGFTLSRAARGAIREGRRFELEAESKDGFDGALMNCYLALIYTLTRAELRLTGRKERGRHSTHITRLRFGVLAAP